jgi:hypothetical protein
MRAIQPDFKLRLLRNTAGLLAPSLSKTVVELNLPEVNMAYHSEYRKHRRIRRMSARQTFAAQGDDLAKKAVMDLAIALGTRWGANHICTRPSPDYALCNVSSDLANQQEKKAANSLLTLGVWGGVAFGAALISAIVENEW